MISQIRCFESFGQNQDTMTIKMKEWLKKNGVMCEKCDSEYAILWNEKQ